MAESAAVPIVETSAASEAVSNVLNNQRMPTTGKRATIDAARAAAAKAHGSSQAKPAFDPRLTALKVMRERKSVRLAAEDGETIDGFQRSDGDDKDHDSKSSHTTEPQTTVDDAKTKVKPAAQTAATSKPSDEKEPSWAAKLRLEHETATKRVAELEQHRGHREAQWDQVHAQVQQRIQERDHAIEDLQSDLKLGQHIQSELMRILEQVAPGDFIKESLDLVVSRHENDKLRRQQDRGGQVSSAAAHASKVQQLHGEIKNEVALWTAKHPELDHKQSPEAKGFWSDWLKSGAPKDGFEARVDNFVAAQRWRASQAGKRSTTTTGRPPKEGTSAPEETIGLASSGVGAGARTVRGNDVSRAGARRLLAEFHAARGVR